MTREITRRGGLIEAGELLDEIRRFCREQGMAESTFGRRAVNDGKFVGRIRDGGWGWARRQRGGLADCPSRSGRSSV